MAARAPTGCRSRWSRLSVSSSASGSLPAMQAIHELPGATFSNPVERGRYDSEKLSALTLFELEKWLTLAIAAYHGTVHSTLGQTPAGRWADGVAEGGIPALTAHPTAFLVSVTVE
jgi:putative transposase